MTRFTVKVLFRWNAKKAANQAYCQFAADVASVGFASIQWNPAAKSYFVSKWHGFGRDAVLVSEGTFRYSL